CRNGTHGPDIRSPRSFSPQVRGSPMTNSPTNSPVNTFTEWGRLQEVIVGDFRNYTIPKRLDDVEISFRSFYHDNIFRGVGRFRRYKLNVYAEDMRTYPEQIEEERAEDLDGIVKLLESFDVIVKRPRAMTEIKEIKTPDWV